MPNTYVLTQAQLEHIVIDEGLIYLDDGLATEVLLGPCRGGGEFSATATYRDIEFDGKRGKTKGFKVMEEINAMLKVNILDHDQQLIGKLTPFVDVATTPFAITSATPGVVPATKYLTNVTLYAKLTGGEYKKITLYNALNEAPMNINAKPKSESEFALEFHAHWNPIVITDPLFKVEEVAAIT